MAGHALDETSIPQTERPTGRRDSLTLVALSLAAVDRDLRATLNELLSALNAHVAHFSLLYST